MEDCIGGLPSFFSMTKQLLHGVQKQSSSK